MSKTVFGSGSIVTSQWLNGAQKIYFDGLEEDWHMEPLDVEDMDTSDTNNGLGTKLVTLDTRQTIIEPKVFHNSPNTIPGPLPLGTAADQYRFTERVVGVDPTAQKHLATKDYVDVAVQAINFPDVDYGSGNSSDVIVQQISSSIDLSDLQPRFKGELLASQHGHYIHWGGDVENYYHEIMTPNNVTADANYLVFHTRMLPFGCINASSHAIFYMVFANGQAAPIGEMTTWTSSEAFRNGVPVVGLTDCSVNTIPIPKDGWIRIIGIYTFRNVRTFAYPLQFCIGMNFYDRKTAQKYFIAPNPNDASKIVVIGPDRMKPVTVGSISQAVTDGMLRATINYTVDNTYIPGNPAYAGSNTVALEDMEILYNITSRVGDPTNVGDPLNGNKEGGFIFGSGVNDGTVTTAESDPLPPGEFLQARIITSAPAKDASSAVTINFQANSPSITSVPSSFAMTAPTDTSLNVTWTAVGGLQYIVKVEELGSGVDGNPSSTRWAWSNFGSNSLFYVPSDARVTGSAGNLTLTQAHSGSTYRATIQAVAPNSLISPLLNGTTPVAGSFTTVTTTGGLSKANLSNAVHGTSLANLTSKVPSVNIPNGSIGIVSSGADKGVYIYSALASPNSWILLAN